jgi:lipopolysaccharide transport system permease protein
VSLMDFLISLVILAVLMAWYQVIPNWQVITLPLFTLLGLCASLGTSLWLAALNVKYRDFRYVIPFVVQFGMYIAPVGWPSEVVRKNSGEIAYQLYALNPMVGVINGFRWAIGGRAHVPMDWNSVWVSLVVVILVTVSGLRYFRATEETFADII